MVRAKRDTLQGTGVAPDVEFGIGKEAIQKRVFKNLEKNVKWLIAEIIKRKQETIFASVLTDLSVNLTDLGNVVGTNLFVEKSQALGKTLQSLFALDEKNGGGALELPNSLISQYNLKVIDTADEGKNKVAGETLSISPDITTVSDPALDTAINSLLEEQKQEEKQLAERRSELEGCQARFERFLIEMAREKLGMDQEINDVHAALNKAEANIKDLSLYSQHINDYEANLALLIHKLDQISNTVVVGEIDTELPIVDASETATPEQQRLFVVYQQDFETLLQVINSKSDRNLEEKLSDAVSAVQTVIGEAGVQLDTGSLKNVYEKLRDLEALAATNDPTVRQLFWQEIGRRNQAVNTAPAAPAPQPEKKGWWSRAKDFGKTLFTNKEVRKAAGKAALDTVTSLLGIKLVTNLLGAAIGKGDYANWRNDNKKMAQLKQEISINYEYLVSSVEKTEQNLPLADYEQIEKRQAGLKMAIDKAHIAPEAKQEILQKLELIYRKYRQETGGAKEKRQAEVERLLDAYLHAKVSGVSIAKDALNFALTASGLSLLRGVMYAGTSMLERARKASREHAKQTSGLIGAESENTFVFKDVFINATRETVRALRGKGAKENGDKISRGIDFVRALGTVARGLGILHLTFSDQASPEEQVDRFLDAVKEKGLPKAAFDNLVNNLERVLHIAPDAQAENHPVHKNIENIPLIKDDDIVPAMVKEPFSSQSFNVQNIPRELRHDEEALKRIFASGQMDGHRENHFTNSTINSRVESGGVRRAVIFEELLKDKQYAAAAKFLEDQGFSQRHLSYLSPYLTKDANGNIDLEAFARNYKLDNGQMSHALFRAMQGEENTILANRGLIPKIVEEEVSVPKVAVDNTDHSQVDATAHTQGAPEISADEQATAIEVEADRLRFERLKNEHLAVVDRAQQGYYDKQGKFHARPILGMDRQYSGGGGGKIGEDVANNNKLASLERSQSNGNALAVAEATSANDNQALKTDDDLFQERVRTNTAINDNEQIKPEATPQQLENLRDLGNDYNIILDDIERRISGFNLKGNSRDLIAAELQREPVLKNFKTYAEKFAAGENPNPESYHLDDAIKFIGAYSRRGDLSGVLRSEELELLLEPNPQNSNILANDSHMVRIKDIGNKPDIILSDPKFTYSVQDGKLVKIDSGGVVVEKWNSYAAARKMAVGQ